MPTEVSVDDDTPTRIVHEAWRDRRLARITEVLLDRVRGLGGPGMWLTR